MKKIEIFLYSSIAAFLMGFANANFFGKRKKFLKEVKRCIRKICNLKKGKSKNDSKTPRATKVFDKFCEVNSKYWEEKETSANTPIVLIEGLFAESGPNYVMRVGSIAKALEKVKNVKLLVLLRQGEKKEPYKKQIWQSFKMNNFVGIFDDIYKNFSPLKRIKIALLIEGFYWWAKILFLSGKRDEFLLFKYKGVLLGDVLYDEIIKETPVGEHTIKRITSKHKKFFKKLFEYFYVSEALYQEYKFQYYVTSHIQYISYGLPVRYFAHHGITIVETTDDMLYIYDDFEHYPRFHCEVNRMIRKKFDNIFKDEQVQQLAREDLYKRFSGESKQIDAQMAYANKQNYSKQKLKEQLGIQNDNPIVFVFAHIFADTPQGASEKMLFADYYVWLVETIKQIRHINNVNWIIKPHPASAVYGEEGDVAGLVKHYCDEKSSVYICPEDFNTAGVLESANVIVTVQGTVGLEYSCVGIPIVLAGRPFYARFGFTYEPDTKEEYFEQLKNINQIKPLDENQKKTAVTVYKGFHELFNKDFSLIDTEIKNLTWGCGCKQDIFGAFELMTSRLESIDPKTRTLYKQVEEYFSKSFSEAQK